MKKEYKSPIMKVRKIQYSHILCNSINCYKEEVSTEDNEYSDRDGYGSAW